VLGEGPNRISAHRVKLAMALRSNSAHWRMRDILRRHWAAVGRRHGVVGQSGQGVDALIDDVIDRTPAALDNVTARLPPDFPAHVAEAILGGVRAAVGRLTTPTTPPTPSTPPGRTPRSPAP
jgi:serine/threonine-protein kinase HipA